MLCDLKLLHRHKVSQVTLFQTCCNGRLWSRTKPHTNFGQLPPRASQTHNFSWRRPCPTDTQMPWDGWVSWSQHWQPREPNPVPAWPRGPQARRILSDDWTFTKLPSKLQWDPSAPVTGKTQAKSQHGISLTGHVKLIFYMYDLCLNLCLFYTEDVGTSPPIC